MKLSRVVLSGAVLCGTIGLGAAPAQASGFSVARFGAEAGHPVADNATALYFNPAALTRSTGSHLYLEGNFAYRYLTYQHTPNPDTDVAEPEGAEGANTDKAKLSNLLASPFVAYTHQLENLTLAAGLYVPFGGRSKFKKNDRFEGNDQFPGIEDGPQRWFNIEGEISTIYVTGGAAYKLGDLSIGLNASLIRSALRTTRARSAAADNSILNEGRSYLNVTGLTYGFALGAMYEALADQLWLGASYTSKPDPFSDEMKLEGELTNYFGAPGNAGDVDFYHDLPDTWRAGGAYRPTDRVELRLSYEYMRWSEMERQCIVQDGAPCDLSSAEGQTRVPQNIPRNWRDTHGVRGGASYFLTPAAELNGGVGYTSNAVPDSHLEPSLPDFDELRLTVGTRVALTDWMRIGAAYSHSIWFSRDNSGESQLAAQEGPSRQPDAGGKYTQIVGALNANIDFSF